MSQHTSIAAPVFVEAWSLEDIGKNGRANIRVHVHGYWSDVITVYVTRDFVWRNEEQSTWSFSVSHSSGGRDKKEISDDMEAEALFARGLLTAVTVARTIRDQEPELTRLFNEERAAQKAAIAAERAAAAAAREADPAMTVAAAKSVVKQLWARAELDGSAAIRFYVRGSDATSRTITVSKARHSGTITARLEGTRIARVELIAALGELSSREAPAPLREV